MNTGIGDAINLAWKLSAVINGQADLSLLESYEVERRAFANVLVNTTDSGFNAVVSQSYLAQTMRTWVVPFVAPLLTKIGYVRQNLFRKVSQLWIEYRHSNLSSGSAGYVHGGDRMPWAVAGNVYNFESLKSISWMSVVVTMF